MNFTEKLVADVAAQAAEIAELKKTLADLGNPPQPEPEPERIDAWRKNIPVFTDADRRAMVAADAEARRAEEKARHDAAREGLEDGYWRDNCGLVRDGSGKIALTAEGLRQKLAKEAEFEKAARAGDLAWRRPVELPIRHGADKTDETEANEDA